MFRFSQEFPSLLYNELFPAVYENSSCSVYCLAYFFHFTIVSKYFTFTKTFELNSRQFWIFYICQRTISSRYEKTKFSNNKWCFTCVRCIKFIGLLKQETDLFILALSHCMMHFGPICAEFPRADSERTMNRVVKTLQNIHVNDVNHH